jgi:hypothetical protein
VRLHTKGQSHALLSAQDIAPELHCAAAIFDKLGVWAVCVWFCMVLLFVVLLQAPQTLLRCFQPRGQLQCQPLQTWQAHPRLGANGPTLPGWCGQ